MVELFPLFRDIPAVACLYEAISSQTTVLTEQSSVYWCHEKLIIAWWLRSQQAVRVSTLQKLWTFAEQFLRIGKRANNTATLYQNYRVEHQKVLSTSQRFQFHHTWLCDLPTSSVLSLNFPPCIIISATILTSNSLSLYRGHTGSAKFVFTCLQLSPAGKILRIPWGIPGDCGRWWREFREIQGKFLNRGWNEREVSPNL